MAMGDADKTATERRRDDRRDQQLPLLHRRPLEIRHRKDSSSSRCTEKNEGQTDRARGHLKTTFTFSLPCRSRTPTPPGNADTGSQPSYPLKRSSENHQSNSFDCIEDTSLTQQARADAAGKQVLFVARQGSTSPRIRTCSDPAASTPRTRAASHGASTQQMPLSPCHPAVQQTHPIPAHTHQRSAQAFSRLQQPPRTTDGICPI